MAQRPADGRGDFGSRGHRQGHSTRGGKAAVRPVFHDERFWYRPRPAHRGAHRGETPGRAPVSNPGGSRHHVWNHSPPAKTMNPPAKILLVEDDAAIVTTLRRVLAGEGYEVAVEKAGDTGLARAQAGAFDVVITDLKLPGLNGLELVRELHAARPRLPVLMMTAHGTTETAIEATQSGAYDYLLKPFEILELLKLVKQAVTASRLMSEPVQLGAAGPSRHAIVGNSRAMQSLYKEIGRFAAKPVSVLIRGETGTGKELIARAIYQHSDRAAAPFVAINCAAIPETLLESELFGKETIPVDVRVIAATHRDLEAAIKQNQFREDLYYRISVVVLNLPPLRERKEDIPDLVRFFLQKYAAEFSVDNPAIHPDAVEFLQAQPWPGNVRELENVTRKMLLLAQSYTISLEHVRTALAKINLPASSTEKSLQACADELLAAAQRGELADAYARLHEAAGRAIVD